MRKADEDKNRHHRARPRSRVRSRLLREAVCDQLPV